MATYNASQLAQGSDLVGPGGIPQPYPASQIFGIPPPPVPPTIMRGMDANIAGLYDVWSAAAPDFAGANYPSSISKTPPLATPLRNIVIQAGPKT